MEVFADSKELARAVGHVLKTVNGRDVSALRLEASDGMLAVSATGSDRWSRSILPAETMEPGVALVGAARFDAVVRALPAGEIRVETDDGWVAAGSDGARLRLRMLDPDMEGVVTPVTPPLPDVMHPVDTEKFARTTDAVAGAIPTDPGMGVLRAIHLTVDGGRMTMEGTDRNLASRAGLDVAGMPDGEWLAPGEWLKTNARNARRIGFTGRAVCIQSDTDTDLTPVLDGAYPRLDRLFSPEGEPVAVLDVDRPPMLAAARMLKNVNFTSRQIVPIRVEPDDHGIRLTLVDADSNGVQHLDADAPVFAPFGVNADYLIDTLNTLAGEKVRVTLREGRNGYAPIMIGAPDADKDAPVHMVAPVRLGAAA